MTQPPLPQFLIIGAVKAATTWIADQLRARDDVFMPGPEPHYFSRDYDRGATWYASLFADARADQLIGEKSADYLADSEAPARAAALLPDAMLIAQLRNPVDRAYSDYCMSAAPGRATRIWEAMPTMMPSPFRGRSLPKACRATTNARYCRATQGRRNA